MRSVLVWLMVLFWGIAAASRSYGAEPDCRPAELFAADSTPAFELQADLTIVQSGAVVTGSTPLDGVFWSTALQQTTYERAREFHLCAAGGSLRTAAEALNHQFNQEAVLTFDYLPPQAPEANAITITVPDIDVARFRAAFAADTVAHHQLRGGSVTATDHTLILIAANDDLDVARRLVGATGGDWTAATIAYGERDLVGA